MSILGLTSSTGTLNGTVKKSLPVVAESKDYSKFKFMRGNRAINHFNLKRITQSMSERYLFSPILVNEKYEIIDGQHRFLALKELNLPIHYIVVIGYGVEEVHILNTNATNWNRLDYLKGYVDLGLRPYIQFQEFMDTYPDFGIKSALHIVSATRGDKNNIEASKRKYFENGSLTIADLEYSKYIAKTIMDFKPFYDGFGRISFVTAVIGIIKHKNYNHEEMLSRLARRPNQITDQTSAINYRLQLEDIFNYHRRAKVSLRY